MFRKMRRAEKKAIPNEETIRLLQESKRGVLAVAGDDDYPYAVPVNYYYDAAAGKIYFHSSLAGHKVDAMKRNPKICFTVYGEPEIKDLDWAPYGISQRLFFQNENRHRLNEYDLYESCLKRQLFKQNGAGQLSRQL